MAPLTRPVLFPALLVALAALLVLLPGCGDEDDTDTAPPFIRFTFPEEFTILSDIATVRVDARDNVGIKHVLFMADGDTLTRLVKEPYTLLWNTTAYPDCTDADPYVLLTALAEDFAGNSRSTDRKFYLNNEGLPPIPVELFAPTNVTKHSVELSWEPSVDYDFSHYILRRGVTDSVTASSDSLVCLDDDPQSTSYTDLGEGVSPFGLLEDTDYYYRVWVYDVYDSSTASASVVSARTLLPQPVVLSATGPITKYKAGLEWTSSTEDVAYYRLHRGSSSQQAALDSIASFLIGTHSYLDSGLTANTTYFYYLYLFDDAGYTHRFRSDDVLEVQTQALPPPVLEDPAPIVTKYSATITWETIPEQEDSSWVALYRGTGATVTTSDVLLYTGCSNETLTYTDSQLQQGRTYSYSMRHRDSQDNTAWSNTVDLTTESLGDVWHGGLGVSRQDKYELELTWDRYSYGPEVDFASYTLSRGGQVIFTPTNAADNRHTDRGLAKNTIYRYRLEVADTSGASVADTMEASTGDILPARIVSLEVDTLWHFILTWLPSAEPAEEFKRYTILRTNDLYETFADLNGDNTADCLLSGNCTEVNSVLQQLPSGTDTSFSYTDADTNLVKLEQHNYVILTYDQKNGWNTSNIMGEILYSPPKPVSAFLKGTSDTTITIGWTKASWGSPALDADLFKNYEVWRSKYEGVTPNSTNGNNIHVATIADINTIEFPDGSEDLGAGIPWYYIVVLHDNFGQAATSNEVMGIRNP